MVWFRVEAPHTPNPAWMLPHHDNTDSYLYSVACALLSAAWPCRGQILKGNSAPQKAVGAAKDCARGIEGIVGLLPATLTTRRRNWPHHVRLLSAHPPAKTARCGWSTPSTWPPPPPPPLPPPPPPTPTLALSAWHWHPQHAENGRERQALRICQGPHQTTKHHVWQRREYRAITPNHWSETWTGAG